jgi:hypothetical protein
MTKIMKDTGIFSTKLSEWTWTWVREGIEREDCFLHYCSGGGAPLIEIEYDVFKDNGWQIH